MEPTNIILSNVTESEKENKILEVESLLNNELAVTKEAKEAKEELSPGDIWEWNLMYGIGNDVY